MTSPETAPPDRLYALLPAIYRVRDAERGYPLRALLRIMNEQLDAVAEDIDRQYDNWFIETAEEWVVPYIGELVGYRPLHDGTDGGGDAREAARIFSPRADIAETIAFRRRRGTLAVHEDLGAAVARWPGLATEFYRRLAWTQNLDFPQLEGERARLASLRSAGRLDLIGSPFDGFARTVDVRRISSDRTQGLHNIPSVGHTVWRLGVWPVTRAPAYCVDAASNCYTFSVLGNDAPLYNRPPGRLGSGAVTGELDAPIPIRRRALSDHGDVLAVEAGALTIRADWAGYKPDTPIPPDRIVAADLSDWRYAPPRGRVAVDPVLGRMRFPIEQLPRRQVSVSYHYGFSAAMGGGEYARRLETPAEVAVFAVGESADYAKLGAALDAWRSAAPASAIIEIRDNRAYVEPIDIALAPGQTLELRAANGARPLIRLLDWQVDAPDALTVTMAERSAITLDGLLVAGRGVTVSGPAEQRIDGPCGSFVTIRHTTLVPGWSIDGDCCPHMPGKPSIELRGVQAHVTIDHAITGPIVVIEDEVMRDPIALRVTDSIVDAMNRRLEAIAAPEGRHAHAVLTVLRSTIFGIVQVHALELGENSIFTDCVHVARRQIGCLRYSTVPRECRTPRRFRCQPDLAIADDGPGAQIRVVPRFTAHRYGQPGYAQLSLDTAMEIRAGADDGAEMGAFHDLYQPQRLENLQTRLDEYTPAGMQSGIVISS